MRHWIFTASGAAVYAAMMLSLGVGVGLCFRQPSRPLYAFFQDYCRANRVTPAKCESLYYARGDTIWLADRPY